MPWPSFKRSTVCSKFHGFFSTNKINHKDQDQQDNVQLSMLSEVVLYDVDKILADNATSLQHQKLANISKEFLQ